MFTSVVLDEPHRCQRPCHTGPCGPCNGVTEVECRCGGQTTEMPCSEVVAMRSRGGSDAGFTCDRRCNRKMSCGRHKCGQYCCISADHQCRLVCGCQFYTPCVLDSLVIWHSTLWSMKKHAHSCLTLTLSCLNIFACVWHCWLGHLTRKNPSPIWPIMCLVGR